MTFSDEQTLDELPRSISLQPNLDKLTILAVDDYSRDASRKILREFFIHTLGGSRNDASANLRFPITQLQGREFYAFADQDDYPRPSKIRSTISKLHQIDSTTICIGSMIDSFGKIRIPKIYEIPESFMSNQVRAANGSLKTRIKCLLRTNLKFNFFVKEIYFFLLILIEKHQTQLVKMKST